MARKSVRDIVSQSGRLTGKILNSRNGTLSRVFKIASVTKRYVNNIQNKYGNNTGDRKYSRSTYMGLSNG
jgi:hypothetical protein